MPGIETYPSSCEALYLRFQAQRREQDYAALIERHQQFAFRVAFARCGRADMAEEAVQEAFLLLARPLQTAAPKGPLDGCPTFRALLFGVVWRSAANLSRTARRVRSRERLARQPRWGSTGPEPTPVRQPDQEIFSALRRELLRLSEEQRGAIILHYLEGLTQREIAKITRVSQPQVARRIALGLALLRTRLQASGHGLASLPLADLLSQPQLLPSPQKLSRIPASPAPTFRAQPAALPPASPARPGGNGLALPRAGWILPGGCLLALSLAGWYASHTTGLPVTAATPVSLAVQAAANHYPSAQPAPRPLTAPHPPDALRRRWTFEHGFPNDFHILNGSWTWLPGSATTPARISGRQENGGGVLLLPLRVPRRPLLVTIRKIRALPTELFHIGWTDGRCNSPYIRYQIMPFGEIAQDTLETLTCAFIDRYLFISAPEEPCHHFDDFGIPYPADQVYISSPDGQIVEIQTRELSTSEVEQRLREIPRLFRQGRFIEAIKPLKFRQPLLPPDYPAPEF